MKRGLQIAVGWAALLASAACAASLDEDPYAPPRVIDSAGTEVRTWTDIEARGELRLLVPAGEARDLAALDTPVREQIRYAVQFARSLDLEPLVVPVDHAEDLIPALLAGRGDVVIANLPNTPGYRDRVAFTVPLDRSQRMLVARADDLIEGFEELAQRTVTVPFDSHFWEAARFLQQQYDGLRVESLPALDEARNLDLVASGDIDLTLAEGNFLDAKLNEREGLRVAFPVSEENGIAWAVRPQADDLRNLLNRFITQQKLVQPERKTRTEDLAGIRAARTLRVATRNSAINYFVWRGQMLGFEYELAEHFARELGVRLEIVVADDGDSLLEMVRNGEADIAAAFLSPVAREEDPDIRWSRPYHRAHQVVVGRAGPDRIDRIADLSGRTFHVRPDSRYERTLRLLAQVHDLDLEIRSVPAEEEPELTLQRVAQGEYDLTLVDEHVVRNALIWIDELEARLTIGREITHHWAVRNDSPDLQAAIDDFFQREHRGLTYNTLYAKYFRDRERVRGYSMQRIDLQHGREISPWDDIVREHAQTYGLDWRLILAQIYQESSFNPQAHSWAGARGLMQIMPRTAQQLGVEADLTDPETSIAAGIRYLDWLRDRFEDDLQVHDRMWFMLAAYNAGIGHVRDARRLAAELGYDRDRWFDNVEIAMEKLSRREYFQHASHGYVRGHEPVGYVRNIRERYLAYILWTEDCWPVCSDAPHPEPREPTIRSPGMIQVRN